MDTIDFDGLPVTYTTTGTNLFGYHATLNIPPSEFDELWRKVCAPKYYEYGVYSDCYMSEDKSKEKRMTIKRVIINEPATIILWEDGSKTVVKCASDEPFDPEKGIAMAYIKHVMFNDKTTKCNKWFDKQLEQLNEE